MTAIFSKAIGVTIGIAFLIAGLGWFMLNFIMGIALIKATFSVMFG